MDAAKTDEPRRGGAPIKKTKGRRGGRNRTSDVRLGRKMEVQEGTGSASETRTSTPGSLLSSCVLQTSNPSDLADSVTMRTAAGLLWRQREGETCSSNHLLLQLPLARRPTCLWKGMHEINQQIDGGTGLNQTSSVCV